MPAQAPVPHDHPVMIAWRDYETTNDFANSLRWAEKGLHGKGAMWAAFLRGYIAGHGWDRNEKAPNA